MKDRYTGDIGDFAKIILLKELTSINGITLGINWYYNKKVYKYELKQKDGKHIEYLKKDKKNLREYDPKLHACLLDIINNEDRKIKNLFDLTNVAIEHNYYKEVPKKKERDEWIENSLQKLIDANLIFLDPDNGICYNYKNGNVKHVFQEEIVKMYNLEKSLIIYNHRDRKSERVYFDKFIKIAERLESKPRKIFLLRASLNSIRDYVFYLQPNYEEIIKGHLVRIEQDYSKIFKLITL